MKNALSSHKTDEPQPEKNKALTELEQLTELIFKKFSVSVLFRELNFLPFLQISHFQKTIVVVKESFCNSKPWLAKEKDSFGMTFYRALAKTIAIIALGWAMLAFSPAWAGNTEEFTVNGLKVILKKNAANEIIAAHLYVRGGVLNVTPETAGLESLLFEAAVKGTAKFPKEKLNAELARMGAQIAGESNRDYGVMKMRCVKTHFGAAWDIFADVVSNPALAPEEVELARERLLTAIRQRQDNPDAYLELLGDAMFFKDHAYVIAPEGSETSVSQITIAQMRQYLRDHLVTSKLLLVVVGNVEKADLLGKVAAAFGGLPVGSYKPHYPATAKHAGGQLQTLARELPTNYIIGYFAAPSLRDADYYAMRAAVSVLNDRVFEEVRTKRHLSYAPTVYLEDLLANCGKLYVTAVEPDTTIKVMLAEVKRLQNRLLDAESLRDKINLTLTGYYLENETNAAQADFLARFELAGLGWKKSEKFVKDRKKVTPEELQAAAQKYLNNIQFVVLGDPAKIDQKLFTSQ
jgi:zinc protease